MAFRLAVRRLDGRLSFCVHTARALLCGPENVRVESAPALMGMMGMGMLSQENRSIWTCPGADCCTASLAKEK
eukprot:1044091-Pelagomonas_calceolata.AAC.2